MTLDSFARHGLALLGDASLKGLLILALVGLALLAGRRASASARHLILLLALASFLALPLLTLALPGWQVPLWPRPVAVLPSVPAVETPPARDAPVFAPSPPDANARGPVTAPSDSPIPETAPIARKASRRRSLPPWPTSLFLLWFTAALLTLAPTLAGLVAVRRLARRCRPVTQGPLAAQFAALAGESGVGRRVTLLRGEAADLSVIPMTWGWRRPTILLPAGAGEWPPDRLRVVLLHELAHIKRGDWPCQMLAHVVCALYWFHPGVWLLARGLRLESERACDDFVLSAGVPADDYARHLLEVIKSMKITNTTLRAVLPMAQPSHMRDRLRAVLDAAQARSAPTRGVIWGVGAALGLLLCSLASLHPTAKVQASPPVSTQRPSPINFEVRNKGVLSAIIHADGGFDAKTKTLHDVTVLSFHQGRAVSVFQADEMRVEHGARTTRWVMTRVQFHGFHGPRPSTAKAAKWTIEGQAVFGQQVEALANAGAIQF